MRRFFPLGVGLALGLASVPAAAQFDLRGFDRQLTRHASASLARPLPRALTRGARGGVSVIVRGAQGVPELFSVGNFAVGELSPARFSELSRAHPEWSFDWAPPRHVLLDRIEGWVHAQAVRERTQTSGQGVVVGIVDTGLDLVHRDFRDGDGKTRVAWLMDVSRSAADLQPELESRYGCTSTSSCAIYSAADLEAVTSNDISGDEPLDSFGHGTHVASLAAGNGLASETPRYVGVAPEATLVIARVAQSDGGIQDANVLRAVKFVFDRADELGMPAVVNLSLGSDFGAHDGTSALEQGLSSLVGPRFPGRAIVLAAGNSAGLYDAPGLAHPGPYGIHTEVQIPEFGGAEVPLITPPASGPTLNAAAYVWLGFREGDRVSVSLVDRNGKTFGPVSVGQGKRYDDGDLEITILNGQAAAEDGSTGPSGTGRKNAVLALTGTWAANRDFRIRLEGQGNAELWVQGEGDLSPESHLGALFSGAQKEGTINVPASASSLIAVGATLNRTKWTAVDGEAIDLPNVGSLENAPLDTIAFFSSAGPNALGAIKPDIVAPGIYVAGAMSRTADPRLTDNPLFASQGRCPSDSECFVVDDQHAITTGTSMASPIVAGAIALLFQRDPTLTQDAARAILQAGARPLEGTIIDSRQVGPGALDLDGALRVATAGESPALRVPTARSWLTLAASHAHPDPNWPVSGSVDLRDDDEQIADGFDESRLRIAVSVAALSEEPKRLAAGLYRFALAAPEGTDGRTAHVSVMFDERVIAEQDLPIRAEPRVNPSGLELAGGCAIARKTSGNSAWLGVALGFGLLGWRRRYMRAK